MWAYEGIFYQIYPIGFCGAPTANDGKTVSRILKLKDWSSYLESLGISSILLNPIFESDNHGYDTRDYKKIDCRLGTNEDFEEVCKDLHAHNVKIVLDGVFNHVGRGFWAFKDVLEKKWDSPYKDWFCINFDGNSCYNDGFWYEGWEGHFELVKLNLDNEQVRNYLLESVGIWIDKLGIDGLRLDVAYMLNRNFMKALVDFVHGKNPEFLMIGEMLHGDYTQLVNPDLLDSVTNYECYKGLYSSFNTHNMHEIGYSLNRQFGPEEWTLYKGLPLYNFVDNHDVERIATQLEDKEHLPLIYAMEFAMPGVPGVYYGSEWGMEGRKEQGSDDSLRPRIHKEDLQENELTEYIAKLAEVRAGSPALKYGDYLQLAIAPDVLVFQRRTNEDRIIFAMNCGEGEFTAHFDAQAGCGTDLITGESVDFGGGLVIKGKTAMIIRTEEVSLP